MIDAERALPGPRRADAACRRRHDVLGTPLAAAVPRRARDARSSAWAASGARSACSGRPPGVYTTAVGYAGGFTPNPTYEEVCSRPHRPHRGRARRLRPGRRSSYEELLQDLLGGPRPDPGHAPGQRRRHAVPLGDLLDHATSSARPREASRDAYQEALREAGLRRDHDRDRRRPARSTTPRTTTSSTSRRTRTATAASAAPASAARSA